MILEHIPELFTIGITFWGMIWILAKSGRYTSGPDSSLMARRITKILEGEVDYQEIVFILLINRSITIGEVENDV